MRREDSLERTVDDRQNIHRTPGMVPAFPVRSPQLALGVAIIVLGVLFTLDTGYARLKPLLRAE